VTSCSSTAVGSDTVVQGGELGEVESTKSVSQVYAPVGGTVVEVNTSLGEQPECINTDAYGEGWLCVIEASAPAEFEELLDAAGYLSLTNPETPPVGSNRPTRRFEREQPKRHSAIVMVVQPQSASTPR